jgi:tellurite resistance protein TerC
MLVFAQIEFWHWAAFIGAVLVFLALDLGVFNREARIVTFKEAVGWTSLWVTLAMTFCVAIRYFPELGPVRSQEFLTGYLIELSLSMDNVFVIALIFKYFRVPREYQHRVLFWGILGALVMRAVMIFVGAALIGMFHGLLYFFGAFIFYSGVKMLFSGEDEVHPDTNPVVRIVRRFFPVVADFRGHRFFTMQNGRRALTPLAVVLVMVETTDLVFALDSIPAIFGVTLDPFIVFTSNIFAILGLRSLYFLLAGAVEYFKFLKVGLSAVLVFIGAKMLLMGVVEIPTKVSLAVVVTIIAVSVLFSVALSRKSRKANDSDA